MKRTRMTAILAALVLMGSLTACGGSNEKMETAEADKAPVQNGIALEDNGDADADADADAGYADAAADMDVADGDEAAEEAMPAGVDAARDMMYDMEYAAMDAEGEAVPDMGAVPKGELSVEAGAPEAEPVPGEEDVVIDDPMDSVLTVQPDAKPGMLTAGEWRDHENWGFFTNLVNNGVISFPSFGIDPTHRISVSVKNAEDSGIANAKAELLDDAGTVLWQSVTGKDGIAYVFEPAENEGVQVRITAADGTQETVDVAAAHTDGQGGEVVVTGRSAEVVLDAGTTLYEDTQVMFIVDTTGSMWDEMLYLQSDFSSIAEELGDPQTSYAVTFYKDEGDSYVTKRAGGFTNNASEIRSQLAAESADGGGDEPEAVAQALSESFETDDWSDESVKIAFLIYDAPPHDGTEETLVQAIRTASEKGIHLVPVVSSNGSRETELFGRAAAICTNGSYVFLTDDSGIGDSHLEPIIGDYEVEKLHDIIVRIIKDYQQ